MAFTIKTGMQDILDMYKKSARAIVRDFNYEEQTKEDYQKREIFEVLQNADDEAEDNNPVRVKFSLIGEKLTIQNTGKPFLEENIGCIMYPGTSLKSLRKNTIGYKGRGFRAVLNWADMVRIITKQFAVEFSREHAVSKITEILDSDADLKNEVRKLIGDILPATIFSYPKIIQPYNNEYATTIELLCLPAHMNNIKNDLISLDFREMLFLSNVSEIIISIEGQNDDRIVKRKKDSNEIRLSDSYYPDAKHGIWKIYKTKGKVDDKEYAFVIARNSDTNIQQELRKSGVLYSYFKVKGVAMPFPFLVHGTFELSSDRNLLQPNSRYNHELINKLAQFIGETAITVSKENKTYDYTPLSLLLPSNNNMGMLDNDFKFSETLSNLVKELALFPAINNTYISLSGNPKYSDKNFCDFVNPTIFTNLLKICDEEIVLTYIKSDCNIDFYQENTFTDLINGNLQYYGIRQKNVLIKLCLEQYQLNSNESHNYPNLIIDGKGNTAKEKIFNNPTDMGNYQDLPDWADFVFINREQELELKKLLNIRKAENFVEALSNFGLEDFRIDRVVSSLFTQANNDIMKTCEVIKWLYNYWEKNNQQFDTNFTNVEPKIITRNGKIVNCSKCFFGKEYNNDIGENIASYLDNAEFVTDISSLGIEEKNLENVKLFLTHLKVKSFPSIEVESLFSKQRGEYIRYNSQIYETLVTQYDELYSHDDFFWRQLINIRVANIENLKTILEKADFYDILVWILSDKNLYNHIVEKNEIDDTAIMIGKPPNKQDNRIVRKSQMGSWLRKQFKETKWIKTKSGKKTDCNNCTIVDNKLSPIIEVVDDDLSKLNKVFGRTMKSEIVSLLQRLDVANDIMDLSKEKVYEILLKLPEIDSSLTIGKSVYENLNISIDAKDVEILINNNMNYREFRKKGKVLSKQNGILDYRSISDVFYLGRKIYSNDILNKYPLLELRRKAGDQKIQKMFCVKPIQSIDKIKIDWSEHNLNQEYNNEYKKLLPYIYAKRLSQSTQKTELSLLKKGKLVLVEYAETKYEIEGICQQGLLDDFELIYTDRTAYIKVPKSFKLIQQLRNEKKFCCAVAEMITTILNIDSDKAFFREILGCNTSKEIEEIIKDDGDTNLSLLNMAKTKFRDEVDYKVEFWKAVANAKNADDKILMDNYSGQLPSSFSYDDLNSLENTQHIINLFLKIGIDVPEYNETAFEPIDIIPFYRKRFVELKRTLRANYLCYIFPKTADLSDYEKRKNEYDFMDIQNVKNSIETQIEEIYEKTFTVSIENLRSQDIFDIEDRISELEMEYKNVAHETSRSSTTVVPTTDYRALYEQIKQQNNNSFIKTATEKPEPLRAYGTSGGSGGGHIYNRENDVVKDKNGFMAEGKVFDTLKNIYGKTGSVVWVSGNGEKAGEIENGDDNLGYDIKYTDESGVHHYVEVKSSSRNNYDDVEFTLPKLEFNFAQKHKENYKIAFVFIENGIATEPRDLGNIFSFEDDEEVYSNSRFTIEQSEYKIRVKIKN